MDKGKESACPPTALSCNTMRSYYLFPEVSHFGGAQSGRDGAPRSIHGHGATGTQG